MSVEDRFAVLAALEQDWDSYGAHPVRPDSITRMRDFLAAMGDVPEPTICPLVDGGLMAEWHTLGIDVEIDLEPDVVSCWYERDGEEVELDDVSPGFVAELLR